MQLGATITAY